MSIEDIKKKLGELYLKDGKIPTNSGLEDWYNKTIEYKNKGLDDEEASKKAAKDTFPSFQDKDTIIKNSAGFLEAKANVRKSHTQSVMVLMQELESLMKK